MEAAADWASLSDEQLLERRISTLGLQLEGTTLEPLIKQLYDELSAKGLVFHPPCHIGDEWFVPVGIPAVFVPFFLVHDRLRVRLYPEGATKPLEVTGRVLSLVPCRNRRAGWVTRISEGMTEWRMGDRVGYGMSEYLDHLQKGE